MRGRKVRPYRIPREKEIFFFIPLTPQLEASGRQLSQVQARPGAASYSVWPYCGQHRAGGTVGNEWWSWSDAIRRPSSGWGNTAHAGIIQAAGERLSWG